VRSGRSVLSISYDKRTTTQTNLQSTGKLQNFNLVIIDDGFELYQLECWSGDH